MSVLCVFLSSFLFASFPSFLFPSLLLLLLPDYYSLHSEKWFSVIFFLPSARTLHADMEGFLRSSFLLRLVSFPLSPLRITVRGQRAKRG